jgi:List-Bact-rpt repeat protein
MRGRAVPILLLVALASSLIAALTGPALAGAGDQTLSVTKVGAGSGSVTSDVQPGIDCGATCSYDFPTGTVVTLTAVASASSTFTGWKDDCSGTGTCQVTMNSPHDVRAGFARSYRPDAWIKLCGLSTGCTINPPPHPWRGNGVYNTTGARQSVSVKMQDGEGVRFWLLFENDGAQSDTFTVDGCRGNRRFRVNKVQIGLHKRPDAGAKKITNKFKDGTAEFSFPPSSQNKQVKLTLNILAPTTAEGVSYECPITIRSQSDPTLRDTLRTKMTTY